MKTIVLVTDSAPLQHRLDEAFGRRASVVLLTPRGEQTRATFDELFSVWSRLADAIVLDAVSLGESARWAIESLAALPASSQPTVAVRLTALQRTVYPVPPGWLMFDQTDPLEYLETTLRTTLELREAQTRLARLQPAAPRPPRPVGPPLPETHRYREALKRVAAILAQRPGVEALTAEVLRWARELFGLARVALFAAEAGPWTLAGSYGVRGEWERHVRLSSASGVGAWLAREGCVMRAGGLADPQAERELELLGMDVAVPVVAGDQLVGALVCGPKITGAGLSDDEVDLLHHLLAQVGLAWQQERSAREAAAQREFWSGVLANLQAGVVILDAQYRVCELNRRAREWLELGAAAAETLTVRQLPSGVAAVILEAGQNGAATQSREVLLPRRQRTLRVSVTQVTAAGRLVWVVLLDDVTAAKEQLAAARQLEEREFFARVAYRLSHELKNSLVSIKIFGQLLPERYNEKDFREQFSSVVVNEVNRVDVLVNNLTFFAQPLGLVYEELSLNDLLAACVENVTQEFARKKIAQVQVVGDRNAEPTGLPLVTVKQTFGHKFARLAGDKIRLMQAFEHILRNAVQAMPQGGRLTIHTADATEADFPGGTLPAGGAVRIEFVDSGEGISLENLRRVTEPFVTTRNVGVGLGLTIVKKIVERHSGRLELDSLLGRGTTVRVWLPVVQQPHSEDKWLAELAKSRSASEFFSGETADDDQNRLAQMMDAHRRRRAAES